MIAGKLPSKPPGMPYGRLPFGLLVLIAAISLIALVVLLGQHLAYKREVMKSTRAHLTSLTHQATRSIDALVLQTVDSVDSIARGLSSGELTKEAALKQLRESLERHPHFFSGALAYDPKVFGGLDMTVYVKKGGRVTRAPRRNLYDYTRPEHDWYGAAITGGPYWSQPFYGKASGAFLVSYSVPFFDGGGTGGRSSPKGVIVVTLSMEEIALIIESLDLGPTGFGALVSQKGVYLYHPDTELVIARKTLADAARELGDRDRLILAAKAAEQSAGILDHRSATTGLNSWLIYAPVPTTGWSLQNTFIKDDLPWDVSLMRRRLLRITLFLILFAASSILLLPGSRSGSRARLWAASAAISMLLAAGIGFCWKVALTHDSVSGGDGIRVGDRATLHRVMNSFTRLSSDRHTEAPVYIPTGIFLETASLNASGDLSLSGYLWQKYRLGEQDSISRGFTIAGASVLEAEKNGSITENGWEVVRWRFRCTVPQDIDHSKYPLEQARLDFAILHKDLNHNVVLVPDLASYDFLNPTALPGLRKGLALPGWRLIRSYFELRKDRYDTSFGLDRPLMKENFPSFHFNIVIRRVFVDAFLSNLTALIIVAILLFTLLMITSRDEKLVGFMQAGSGRILSICAAMFFVTAFSHVDIRRRVAAEQIFYLEYFYFLTYLAILLICMNSVLFSMGANIPLIRHRENLLFKLVFWPFLLGLLLVITLAAFY
jgi:hypothetical protein